MATQGTLILRMFYTEIYNEVLNFWRMLFTAKFLQQKFFRKIWEGTNVALRRHIGNLKNTYVGAHRRVPRQPHIGGWSKDRSSDVYG